MNASEIDLVLERIRHAWKKVPSNTLDDVLKMLETDASKPVVKMIADINEKMSAKEIRLVDDVAAGKTTKMSILDTIEWIESHPINKDRDHPLLEVRGDGKQWYVVSHEFDDDDGNGQICGMFVVDKDSDQDVIIGALVATIQTELEHLWSWEVDG